MSEKKSPLEVALEKDCIFLFIASFIPGLIEANEDFSTKCRGPECAEFDWFTSRCGFSK